MESETETENYKNTSMPPSARLEQNKKKEPFSSAAAGSLISGHHWYQFTRVCRPRRLPVLRFPGWSEHPQRGASRGSQDTGGPAPPRLSSRDTGPWAVLGDGSSHRKGGSVIRDTWDTASGGPVPPSRSHTSHPSLGKRPPCHTVTQVLPSFPDRTSKELRGSLEVLACWLPAPVSSALASCLHHDPAPGLGYPICWLRDRLPSFLLCSSEPAAYGFTPISPVGMSSPFSRLPIAQGVPADSSSRAPCSAHCGSLKAPWEWPLWSPSPPGLHFSASRR